MEIVNDIVPVLNGRDSRNNVAYLGPNRTVIHRYLVVLYVAKFSPTFSLWGENFGDSIYFSIYSLSNVAKAFRRPINFDRTKTATNIYKRAEEKGLVEFKKSQGRTYVTTTHKGDEQCSSFIKDFIVLARIHEDTSSDVSGFTSKGFNTMVINKKASEFYKNLIVRTDDLNTDFEDLIESDGGNSE
jgi:hypothetical protein